MQTAQRLTTNGFLTWKKSQAEKHEFVTGECLSGSAQGWVMSSHRAIPADIFEDT